MAEFLIDTDVLIDYLRDQPESVEYLEKLSLPLSVSAVTVAELYAGVRDGRERLALDQFVRSFRIVAIDEEISVRAGILRRDYGKSHGTGLADAIIAATKRNKPDSSR